MSPTATQMQTVQMYSCEGARVLRDEDGNLMVEILGEEPKDEDWRKLLDWVQGQGYTFGPCGPTRFDADEFDDGLGDRFVAWPSN